MIRASNLRFFGRPLVFAAIAIGGSMAMLFGSTSRAADGDVTFAGGFYAQHTPPAQQGQRPLPSLKSHSDPRYAPATAQLTKNGAIAAADYRRSASQRTNRLPQVKRERGSLFAQLKSHFGGGKKSAEPKEQATQLRSKPQPAPAIARTGGQHAVQQATFRDAVNRGQLSQTRPSVGHNQRQGLFDFLGSESSKPTGNRYASKNATRSQQRKLATKSKQRQLASSKPLTSPKPLQSPQLAEPLMPSDEEAVFVMDDSPADPRTPAEAPLPTLLDSAGPKLPRPKVDLDSLKKLSAQTKGVSRPKLRPVESKPLVIKGPLSMPLEPLTEASLLAEESEPTPPPAAEYPETEPLPLAAAVATEPVDPNPVPVGVQPIEPSPRAVSLLAQTNQFAQQASSEDHFTFVIRRCRHVLAIDRSPQVVQYSHRLAAWALNKRGEVRSDRGQAAEAMTDFQDALRMDTTCWRARHNRGVLLAQQGNYAEAFDAFNETIDHKPDFAKAYSNRASLYIQAGDFDAALTDYGKAISINPDLAIAHKGRGRVCHMMGQIDQALQHFDAAILLDPQDATTATCRADLLVDMGRYAAAHQAYQQAAALDQTLPSAPRNLAWLQATCPDRRFVNPEQALANAQLSIELLGEADDVGLDTLAAAQAAAGDFAAAAETMRRAISLVEPHDEGAYRERLATYESGQRFVSNPVAQVQQAGYQQMVR